jgi:ribosomal protein L30E
MCHLYIFVLGFYKIESQYEWYIFNMSKTTKAAATNTKSTDAQFETQMGKTFMIYVYAALDDIKSTWPTTWKYGPLIHTYNTILGGKPEGTKDTPKHVATLSSEAKQILKICFYKFVEEIEHVEEAIEVTKQDSAEGLANKLIKQCGEYNDDSIAVDLHKIGTENEPKFGKSLSECNKDKFMTPETPKHIPSHVNMAGTVILVWKTFVKSVAYKYAHLLICAKTMPMSQQLMTGIIFEAGIGPLSLDAITSCIRIKPAPKPRAKKGETVSPVPITPLVETKKEAPPAPTEDEEDDEDDSDEEDEDEVDDDLAAAL